MKVKKGDKVKVEYIGKFKDGSVFDSSNGRSPLCFEVDSGQVVPGFDKAVEGMEVNKEKSFTLQPAEAYGNVRVELIQEVPRNKLPPKPEPEVGMTLVMSAPTGRHLQAQITKVADSKVTIDLNHPLAGRELTFTVKVVGINEPEEDSGCNGDSCAGCSCGH